LDTLDGYLVELLFIASLSEHLTSRQSTLSGHRRLLRTLLSNEGDKDHSIADALIANASYGK